MKMAAATFTQSHAKKSNRERERERERDDFAPMIHVGVTYSTTATIVMMSFFQIRSSCQQKGGHLNVIWHWTSHPLGSQASSGVQGSVCGFLDMVPLLGILPDTSRKCTTTGCPVLRK